jgi:hypothetical protein
MISLKEITFSKSNSPDHVLVIPLGGHEYAQISSLLWDFCYNVKQSTHEVGIQVFIVVSLFHLFTYDIFKDVFT